MLFNYSLVDIFLISLQSLQRACDSVLYVAQVLMHIGQVFSLYSLVNDFSSV